MARTARLAHTEDFWIEVSCESDETRENILSGIGAIQRIHAWSVKFHNKYFLENLASPPLEVFREQINILIKTERLWRHTQRYTLERAAEQTVAYFNSRKKFDEEMRYVPVLPQKIDTLQIRAREVWKRHMALAGMISTTYGGLYLEGNWKGTLREQAGDIPIDLFPFLWHSVYLRYKEAEGEKEEIFQIKFNFHAPKTRAGKQATKEMEKQYGEV